MGIVPYKYKHSSTASSSTSRMNPLNCTILLRDARIPLTCYNLKTPTPSKANQDIFKKK